ncbi:MAG: chromosomal replication initiator protein DnaA [Candidatus Curtissbacteria bacterium]|nr:chromosomal replication initiator protein DnaA [Candidatus Curtissbacteria bacterium]
MNGQKVWASILSGVKSQVSSSTFKTWFSGSYVMDFREEESRRLLVVGVKNNFLKEQVETRYQTVINDIIRKKGFSDCEVTFVVSEQTDSSSQISDAPLFSGEAPTFINSFKKIDNLNPLHTFDNFVVGASNNLAFLAFKQVSENPGTSYNPLFVYGATGVGKTHLLQSCGNEILNKIPDAKVLYASAEKFTNDYIESLNNRTQSHFRHKYRNVDVLLVDDVQFLAGKESTQDEFFYTFNELYLAGKQIVLASDHHPRDLGKLKDRLVSRFLGGMAVDISRPDLELRVAILKAKCKEKNVVLGDGVLNFIADSSQGGVRELEGLLLQVLSLSKLTSGGITLDEIKRAIERNKRPSVAPPSPGKIIDSVSRHFRVPREELCGPKRKANIVFARQILMFILREDLGLALEAIGELVGGRDHSTIIYGVERVNKLIGENQNTRDEVARIRANFQQN